MKILTLMWLLAMKLTMDKVIMVTTMMIVRKKKMVITVMMFFLLSLMELQTLPVLKVKKRLMTTAVRALGKKVLVLLLLD